MKLKELLGLYSLNWNQIKQTWNFNRFFVLLNRRLRVSDAGLTQILGDRRGPQSGHSVVGSIGRGTDHHDAGVLNSLPTSWLLRSMVDLET